MGLGGAGGAGDVDGSAVQLADNEVGLTPAPLSSTQILMVPLCVSNGSQLVGNKKGGATTSAHMLPFVVREWQEGRP